MKVVVAVFLVVLGLAQSAWAEDVPDHALWSKNGSGQAADLSHLVDLDGHSFQPAAAGPNTIILVHFWATWCEPCLEEFPHLDQLAKQLAERHIAVVAVAEDRGGADDVRTYMDKHGWLANIKILLDPGRKTARTLGVSVLPTTIVVDNQVEMDRITGSCAWGRDDVAHLGDNIGN